MRLANALKLAAVSTLFMGVQSANALVLTIDDLNDGAAATMVDDATDSTPNDGLVLFSGEIGSFQLNVSTGAGDPAIGGGNPGFTGISLDFFALSKGGPSAPSTSALDIELVDTGLSIATNASGQAVVDSPISFNTTGAGPMMTPGVTVQTFININGGGEQLISTLTGSNGSAFSSNESLFASLTENDTFDLRTVVNIRHDSKSDNSAGAIDITVAPIPVPAALPLFLTALFGLGFVSRRRRAAA